MRNYNISNKEDIKPYNILWAFTTRIDYEMDRTLLLTDMPNTRYDEYVLVEGGHCSCYDFDETQWNATVYSIEELEKLLTNLQEFEIERKELKRFLKYYHML